MKTGVKGILSIIICIIMLSSCSGRRKTSPPQGQEDSAKSKGTILFVNTEEGDNKTLYRVNEDGKEKEKVLDKNIMGIAASGGKIAFLSKDEEKLQTLYMINADGTGLQTVMNNTYIKENSLSWSSEGGRVAYVAKLPSDKGYEVYYVDAGKYKTPHRVTDDTAFNESPKFSNDGRFIVYAKNDERGYDIYKYDMGTGMSSNLSNNTADDASPVVSTDGTKIIFLSDEAEKGKYDLYSMNMDGGGRARLTNGLNIEKDTISISPDSSMIAFVTIGAKGEKAVHIIDMNKSTVMVSNGGYILAWSGDSKALYFASGDEGNRKIVKYDITGRSMKDIVKISIKPGEPSQGITFVHYTEKLK